MATILNEALTKMFKFIGENYKDIILVNRKWEIVGQDIWTTSSGKTYSTSKCDWVEYQTKIIDTDRLHFTILNSENPKRTEQMRGWQLTTEDHSNYNYYKGGMKSKVIVSGRIVNTPENIKNLTKFIKKIPKRSRKKLFKLLYLYNKSEEKNFVVYERLFSRLRTRFNLEFSNWSFNNIFQWEKIIQTFPPEIDRNRKLNRLLRFFRK